MFLARIFLYPRKVHQKPSQLKPLRWLQKWTEFLYQKILEHFYGFLGFFFLIPTSRSAPASGSSLSVV